MFLASTTGEVITIITLGIGLVSAIVTLIPTVVACIKSLKKNIEDKNWTLLAEYADKAMNIVEKSGITGPAEKKAEAIALVKSYCISNNIKFDENIIFQLGAYIDDTIDFVNKFIKEKEGKK